MRTGEGELGYAQGQLLSLREEEIRRQQAGGPLAGSEEAIQKADQSCQVGGGLRIGYGFPFRRWQCSEVSGSGHTASNMLRATELPSSGG